MNPCCWDLTKLLIVVPGENSYFMLLVAKNLSWRCHPNRAGPKTTSMWPYKKGTAVLIFLGCQFFDYKEPQWLLMVDNFFGEKIRIHQDGVWGPRLGTPLGPDIVTLVFLLLGMTNPLSLLGRLDQLLDHRGHGFCSFEFSSFNGVKTCEDQMTKSQRSNLIFSSDSTRSG